MLCTILLPLLTAGVATALLTCRPEGPVVPSPSALGSSSAFRATVANLTSTIERALNGSVEAGWAVANTSFSLAVVDIGSTGGVPLWEYHHLGSANTRGTPNVTRDSLYLIGSISKVLTDLVLLRSGVDVDAPVTVLLPELAGGGRSGGRGGGRGGIEWEHISLRALASHTAGIPPNYGFSEFYFLKDYFEVLGLPHLEASDYADCSIIGLNAECTTQQFLQGMRDGSYYVAPPYARPVYSNAAFRIISHALEAATGKNYSVLIRELVTGPLGMTNTLATTPPNGDEGAVIPPVENNWGGDYGANVPAGGIISTISDPTRLIREILALSPLILPTPAEVRAWLHPYSFAGSPATFVGTPWEIFMPEPGELTPAHPHSVAVFSKGGGAYGYRSQMSLVPEYGIGVVTLTAGDGAALTTLHGALLSTVVSAADEAAREEARVLYVGSFTGPCPQTTQSSGNGTAGGGSQAPKCWVNATLELDGDSLVLSALQRNGSDVLAPFGAIWNVTLGAFVGPLETPATFRVFPAEIVSPPEDIVLPGNAARPGTTKVRAVREDWRLWWPITLPPAGPEFPGDRLAEQDCLRWSVADWLYYGQEPVDRVVVVREWLESESRAGRVLALDVPFLRSGLLLPTVTE